MSNPKDSNSKPALDNMRVWNQVKETPTTKTKPNLSTSLTSINGSYCFERATELFGPVGLGWGYSILESLYKEGTTHFYMEKVTGELKEYKAVTHTIKLKLWYKLDGEKGELINYGHTPYIIKSKYGPYLDQEVDKKSLTDAIKKCLSMLGIGADIHQGQFDDQSYLEYLAEKEAAEKEIKDEEKAIKDEEKTTALKLGISEHMKEDQQMLKGCTTEQAVNQILNSSRSFLNRECGKLGIDPKKYIDRMIEVANSQKTNIAIKENERQQKINRQ